MFIKELAITAQRQTEVVDSVMYEISNASQAITEVTTGANQASILAVGISEELEKAKKTIGHFSANLTNT